MIDVDIDRNVHCLLGLVVDAVDMEAATDRIKLAVLQSHPFLLSTPNVNFLINNQRDVEFREAVLNSDLSVVDGMPLIWIARLLGVPLPERVAGSDLFENLKQCTAEEREPVSVFLFGGEVGVGKKACNAINSQAGNMTCVGALDPGFISLEDMSSDEIIAEINDSGADFLVVALGAVKGHIWLERNKDKLQIPLRSHLGAVIGFEAGNIVRSPGFVSRLGFEWLWRIKEEPKLWRRYWSDGVELMAMLLTRVLPLVCSNLSVRYLVKNTGSQFFISSKVEGNRCTLSMSGHAGCENLYEIRECFQTVVNLGLDVVLDFSKLEHMSASALGTLMMLKKQLKHKNTSLRIARATAKVHRLFKWHGLAFMLEASN